MLDSLVFATNATLPIVLIVAIGYVLKRIGFITKEFAKMANKIVFRILLPVMLFINVYGITDPGSIDLDYAFYTAIATVLTFLLGIPAAIMLSAKRERRAALLQSFFRSNYAIIGIPLAESLFGSDGALVATLLSAIMIPIFNTLAVIALSIFAKPEEGEEGADRATRVKERIKKVLLGIIKNPLILSIFAGFIALGIRALFTHLGIGFRLNQLTPIWSTMKSLSSLATPLALLALGGQFEFSLISEAKREIISGTLVRVLILPVIALSIAVLFFRESFSGAEYAALIAVFCTPVAVSSVPMAQELGADAELAGQLVIFTTIFSSFTIFIASFIFKAIGIF
ncbi:MAG: AEC family transporter [Clostridia bacterium]|nr:AEC family transporter [Clostridia bacterium]